MAVTSLGAFLANPRIQNTASVLIVHYVAVIARVAFELAGAIPSTFIEIAERVAARRAVVTAIAGRGARVVATSTDRQHHH